MNVLNWLILAEAKSTEGGAEGGTGLGILPPLVMMFAVFYFLILRPGANDKKRHASMLQNLKKNDKVATIGGIVGTVANISSDGKEITLKVDDSTRIKFLRTHIGQVLTDDGSDEKK